MTPTGAAPHPRRLDGEVLADVPAASLHEDAPRYDRPLRRRDRSRRGRPGTLPAGGQRRRTTSWRMLADTVWVWRAVRPPAVPQHRRRSGRRRHGAAAQAPGDRASTPAAALALTADGNHRVVRRRSAAPGTARVVAEAVLNLACVGARPLALVNCLNFGNPEHPEVMWELSEAIDGMAEACRALGVPVVGGQREPLQRERRARHRSHAGGRRARRGRRPPAPAARHRSASRAASCCWSGPEPAVPSLAGSRWAWDRGAQGGHLDPCDATAHLAVAGLVRSLVAAGLAQGVHDVAEGGLALALAEAAIVGGTGVRIDGVDGHAALFAEAPSCAVLCVAADDEGAVTERARRAGVAVAGPRSTPGATGS